MSFNTKKNNRVAILLRFSVAIAATAQISAAVVQQKTSQVNISVSGWTLNPNLSSSSQKVATSCPYKYMVQQGDSCNSILQDNNFFLRYPGISDALSNEYLEDLNQKHFDQKFSCSNMIPGEIFCLGFAADAPVEGAGFPVGNTPALTVSAAFSPSQTVDVQPSGSPGNIPQNVNTTETIPNIGCTEKVE